MASSVYPIPSGGAATTTFGQQTTVPAAGNLYKFTLALGAGVYNIACISSTVATITFLNGSSEITTVTTTSGAVTATLSTASTHAVVSINTGTNIDITFTQTKVLLPNGAPSGTLYTITSTQTFTGRGKAWVCLVGGGDGGNGGYPYQSSGGSGGASGYVHSGIITLTEDVLVTIGTAGTGGTRNNNQANNGNAGNHTTVGNLLSSASGSRANGASGQYESGGTRRGNNGNVSAGYPYPWITNLGGPGNNGLTGSGGSSSYNYAMGAEGGNGGSGLIGAGGKGGWDGVPAANATGYGGGGGAGGTNNQTFNNTNGTFLNLSGGNGSPGIAYIVVL